MSIGITFQHSDYVFTIYSSVRGSGDASRVSSWWRSWESPLIRDSVKAGSRFLGFRPVDRLEYSGLPFTCTKFRRVQGVAVLRSWLGFHEFSYSHLRCFVVRGTVVILGLCRAPAWPVDGNIPFFPVGVIAILSQFYKAAKMRSVLLDDTYLARPFIAIFFFVLCPECTL